ncbi:hypothetical protein JP0048_01920 [Helicobacter pylori]|nr:hypothetical protein JP0046_07990 [Helicobacter pylori]GHP70308.1 hypothetical protein JP0048_01920 [Helicobacter pylori]GHQ38598.1 hypothetical protein JP0067_01970 [Helicobacter pylori]GHS16357.1 hypothetical protein JP0117_01950 [Helicobacter pylori]
MCLETLGKGAKMPDKIKPKLNTNRVLEKLLGRLSQNFCLNKNLFMRVILLFFVFKQV